MPTTTLRTNLQCIFFVEVSGEYSERNVDDKECKHCRPDCDVVDEFLTQVVEDSVEVDRIDRSDKPGSKASQQVTAELHLTW